MEKLHSGLFSQLYDLSVHDWPGELDFYLPLASECKSKGRAVLEVACGTGRVAIRLTQVGVQVTGLDSSTEMLAIASQKSIGLDKVRWVNADMRDFDLDEQFGLVVIPGHSFQFMLTSQDQLACLRTIRRHLTADGTLVVHIDHQDFNWLGNLPSNNERFVPGELVTDPVTERIYRPSRAWSLERSTQTATLVMRWERIDLHGEVVESWHSAPTEMHCLFRFEMEHLLARAGFTVDALYGSFDKQPLTDTSSEMIWVCKPSADQESTDEYSQSTLVKGG